MATINTPIINKGSSSTQQISHSSSTNIHRLHNWVFLTEAGKTANTEFVSFDNVTIKITDDGTNRFLTVYLAGHNLIVGSIFNLTSVNPTTNNTYFDNNPTFTVTTVVNTAIVQVNLGNVLLNLGNFTASINYTRTISYTSADIGKRCRVVENNTFYDLVSFDVSNAPVWINAHGASTLQSEGDLIATALAKTTPVDTDQIGLMDSSASNILKKLSWANIKANLKSYFDSIYQTVLISGSSIKTINNTSILGSGDITISGGSSNLTGFTSDTNTTIGTNAGGTLDYLLALYNTIIGSNAGKSLTNVTNNTLGTTAIGYNSLANSIYSFYSTFIGAGAGEFLTSAQESIGIGANSLRGVTGTINALYVIGIGNHTFSNISDSNTVDSVAIGYSANSSGGLFCTSVGNLANTAGGGYNTSIGYGSLRYYNVSETIAIGYQALNQAQTGTQNIGIGNNALRILTGSRNTALGYDVGGGQTTGNDNVLIGHLAGIYITTGSNNVCIGSSSGTEAAFIKLTTQNNQIVLGNNSTTNARTKVAWTVGSDERDKTNIAYIDTGLSFINNLKPVQFKYRLNRDTEETAPESRLRYGFLAQDILPLEDTSVIVDNTTPEVLGVNETMLIPILVNAIKELTARIVLLEAKIN